MMPMASEREDLKTHIKTCLSFLDTHFISVGAAKNVAKVFSITEKEAVKALKATVVFHDYGKAAQEYQQKASSRKLSFPKHEYFSAAAAWQTLADTSWKTECIIAILWHHMAMRGPNFAVDIKTWDKFKAPESATIVERFVKVFREILQYHELDDVVVGDPPEKITFAQVDDLTKKMYQAINQLESGMTVYRRSLKLLRPLLIVDNLAAAHHRGGLERVFVKDLPNPKSVLSDASVIEKLMKNG